MNPLIFLVAAAAVVFVGIKKPAPSEGLAVEPSSDPFTRWDSLFKKYELLNQVPFGMLKAICMNESSLGTVQSVAAGISDPKNVDASQSEDRKSFGLMQMTLTTLRDFDKAGDAVRLNNPEYSVKWASRFLRSLIRQFPLVDPRWEEWVVKSYNQGAGNTRKEQAGEIDGYAAEYWARYQRNRQTVLETQGV